MENTQDMTDTRLEGVGDAEPCHPKKPRSEAN